MMARTCSVVDTARCDAPPGTASPGWLVRCRTCARMVCIQCSLRVPYEGAVERICHQCLRHSRDDLGYRPLAVAHVEALLGMPVRDDLAATLETMGFVVPATLRVPGLDT